MFKSSLTLAAFAAFTFVVVGCGSSENSNTSGNAPSATPTPTPLVFTTPTPTPDASTQITCTSKQLAVGVKVFYSGTKGSAPYADANKAYIGTVVQLYNNGTAKVHYDAGFDAYPAWSVLMPEATCTTDLTNYDAIYVGAVSANFPAGATYDGKVKMIFAGGNAQIDWSHLAYDTVEKFSDLAIQQ